MEPSNINEGESLYWDNPDGGVSQVEVVREYNGYNVKVYHESEVNPDGREVLVNPDQLHESEPSE